MREAAGDEVARSARTVPAGRATAHREGAQPDAVLIRAAQLGDHEAFAVIVDRYGPGMLQYAKRLCAQDEATASDAVQDAFISAWRSLPGFEQRSSLKTWLYRLVHRRATDLIRVRRPIPIDDQLLLTVERATADDPERELLTHELIDALRAALHELSWNQRAVWLLRETEGMTYADIATTLAMSQAAVRGHLHRARRNLAERMARWR